MAGSLLNGTVPTLAQVSRQVLLGGDQGYCWIYRWRLASGAVLCVIP